MLIEWVGDVYERRGIGVMKGGALEPFWPGCEWNEIRLGLAIPMAGCGVGIWDSRTADVSFSGDRGL